METEAATSFGEALRRYRAAAGLTQQELAARAGLSVRGISDLERGVRMRPHRDTVQLLAAALGLEPGDREALQQMARRPADGATVERRRSNVPVQLTSFVGRAQEMAAVSGLLDHTRLLTLTGAGGVGKTRLALQVAAGLLDRYRDGVWLVDLAPVTDPALVLHALAAVLDVRGDGSRPLHDTLVEALRHRHLLLVLDNCEHVLEACAPLVEALLRGAPYLHVLATSREALACAGETAWRVPSLTLPAVDQRIVPDALAQSEAVQLFVERAGLAQPGFALGEHNAAAVAQVCRRLDGIPLALLRWDVDTNAGEEAARLHWALDCFWYLRSPTTAGEWNRQILALPALAAPSRWRARMLVGAAFAQPNEATRCQLLDEALTLSRQLGDQLAEANALHTQGLFLQLQGQNKQAQPLLDESLALFESLGERGYMSVVLCVMAEAACNDGAYEHARALVAQILALTTSTGNLWHEAIAREILGQVAFDTGDLAAAARLWHSSQETFQEVGDSMGLASIAARLGSLAARQGDYGTARRRYADGLTELVERGCTLSGLGWLADLAIVLVAGGHPAEGLCLAAASEALNAAYGVQLSPLTREEHDHAVMRARTELGEQEAAALWAEGQTLTIEQAIMVAVQENAATA